jgi:hypothetical protein
MKGKEEETTRTGIDIIPSKSLEVGVAAGAC